MTGRLSKLSFTVALFTLIFLISLTSPYLATADPANLVVEPTAAVGSTADITFNVHDEGAADPGPGGGEVVLRATTDPTAGVGHFVDGSIFNVEGDNCNDLDGGQPSGLGTKQLVWDGFDCLVDLDFDMVIEQASGTAAFLCTGQGTVEFTLEQNGQTVGGSSTVTTCQAPVSTPVDLTLELTSEIEDEIAVCPSTARIEARVLDVDDDPLPDGIVINFVARGAELTSGFAVTIDGFAETTLQVAADAPPEIEVLATATVQGVSLSERLDIDVACGRAFEPSNVNFVLSSNTVECGTSAFLGGRVVDDDGATVGDGTPVMLLATHGTVEPAQTTTTGGLFTVTYMAPATPVVDTVTVAVKGFFESTQIIVPCQGVQPSADGAAPGGALTGSGAGAEGVAGPGGAAGAGGISPPRTGDQGAIRPPNTGSGGLR